MSELSKNGTMAIVVDDGSRRVPIQNGDGEEIGFFRFRPTDLGIIERYNSLAARFDEITEPLSALGADEADEAQRLAALKEAEKRLNEAVNMLFDGDAAGAFFGRMNPFSPVGGEFYCEQVLRVVGQYISEQFDTETEKLSARAKAYAARKRAK